jgi:hypothetical protein
MTDQELVLAYAPVLFFSEGENFFPMEVEKYLQDCSLHLHDGDNAEKMLLPPGSIDFRWVDNPLFNTKDKFLIYRDRRGTSKTYLEALVELWKREPLEEAAWGEALLEALPAPAAAWLGDVRNEIQKQVEKVTGSVLRKLAKKKAYDDLLTALERAIGPEVYPDDILARALRQYQDSKSKLAFYYRVKSSESYYDTVAQYWYFYAFNPYINRHEADWESVTLFFHEGTPVRAFYSSHEGGDEYDWLDLERTPNATTNSEHPLVYAARASHANYSSIKNVKEKSGFIQLQGNERLPRDQFKPGGKIVGTHHDATNAWEKPVELDNQPWLRFEGRWGVDVQHSGGQLPDDDESVKPVVRDDDLAAALVFLLGQKKLEELTGPLRRAPVGPRQHNNRGEWDDPTRLLKPIG